MFKIGDKVMVGWKERETGIVVDTRVVREAGVFLGETYITERTEYLIRLDWSGESRWWVGGVDPQ